MKRLRELLFLRRIRQCDLYRAANSAAGTKVLCDSRMSQIVNGHLNATPNQKVWLVKALLELGVEPETVQDVHELR